VASLLRYGSVQGIRLELNSDPLPEMRGKGKLDKQEARSRTKPNVILAYSSNIISTFQNSGLSVDPVVP
jgi:hypothetical protein